MAIGHHINDRSHTIEKRINTKADTKEEHHELINVDEGEHAKYAFFTGERPRVNRALVTPVTVTAAVVPLLLN